MTNLAGLTRYYIAAAYAHEGVSASGQTFARLLVKLANRETK